MLSAQPLSQRKVNAIDNSIKSANEEKALAELPPFDIEQELHLDELRLSKDELTHQTDQAISPQSKLGAFINDSINAFLTTFGVASSIPIVLSFTHIKIPLELLTQLLLVGSIVGSGVLCYITYKATIRNEKEILDKIALAEIDKNKLLEETHNLYPRLNKRFEAKYDEIKHKTLHHTDKKPAIIEGIKKTVEIAIAMFSASTAIYLMLTGIAISAMTWGGFVGFIVFSIASGIGFGIAAAYRQIQLTKKETYLNGLEENNKICGKAYLKVLKAQKSYENNKKDQEIECAKHELEDLKLDKNLLLNSNQRMMQRLKVITGINNHNVHLNGTASVPSSPMQTSTIINFPTLELKEENLPPRLRR